MTAMSSRPADSAAHKRTLEVLSGGAARFSGCSSIRHYNVQEKLGEGTFGEVYKGRSLKTNAIVAMKKILVHNEKDGFPITALREIRLLKELSHVNVLRLEEMVIERKKEGKKRATMYMVTPYMEHDLSGLLENPQVRFTVPQIKCYMLQLLRGLKYLHENQILHRDMKAANLLINNKGILQIADFGLARHFDEMPPQPGKGNGEALRDYTGLVVTRWYRPPELLLQLRRYTPAIDMWGVGCVFGEMFTRKPILAGSSEVNQIQIIFDLVGNPTEENMPGWSSLPGCEGVKEFRFRPSTLAQRFRDQGSAFVSLLSELLKLDWRKRINAIDALNHPYFHMEPLPARPEDIPQFEDSHELDRRKFRGQMAALPPAPAGGTVGMGAGGDWSNGAAAQNRGGWAGNGMNGYGSGNRNGYQHPPNHHHPHGNAHDQRWDRGRPMGMGGGGGGGGGGGRDHYAPRNGYDRMNSSNTRLPGYGGGGGGGVHAHPERQSTGIRDYPPHPSLPPRPDWATADAGGNNGGRVRIPPRNAPRDRGTDKYIPSYSGHRPRSSGSNGGWNGPQRARANNYNNNNNNNHNDNNGRRRGSSGSDWEREGDPDPKVERDRRQRSRSRSRSPLRRNDRERDIEKMRERDRELYRR